MVILAYNLQGDSMEIVAIAIHEIDGYVVHIFKRTLAGDFGTIFQDYAGKRGLQPNDLIGYFCIFIYTLPITISITSRCSRTVESSKTSLG